jgi:hypothetical protein
MKSKEELIELMTEYEKEYQRYNKEYDKLIKIVKNKNIPSGKEESLNFHRDLKEAEYGKMKNKANLDLLKYILE